ncbi:DUF5677 domain-containing protein [Pedobacter sp. R-06]|uniref:DUF5677 domain-containing protein n=1 Tax=Pedobacter sp. R-06 TaxID=3404051 RepID=UPI003CEE720A
MMKIEDLIIDGLDHTIARSLESVRKDMKISEKDFRKLLDEEDGKAYDILYDVVSEYLIDRDFTSKYLQQWRVTTRSNQAKVIGMHKKPFLYFFAYLHTCFQIYNRTRMALDGRVVDKTTILQICFYGNLCRMGDEIGILLSNGYTSAALTLWRTFYEHAVIGLLILKENSEELTDRFDASGHRDLEARAESYKKRHEDLKFPPLEAKVVMDIEQKSAWLKENFDGQLFKQDYGWASTVIKEKPTFRAIEAHVEMGRFRPFYIWASTFAHPSFERLTDFWGEGDKIVLDRITKQDEDLQAYIDPMQLTMACFQEINIEFLNIFSIDHQYDANVAMLGKIYDKLTANFKRVDD